jgi:putative tricarboxylic transport membrane protein
VSEQTPPLSNGKGGNRALEIAFAVALILFSVGFIWQATLVREPFTTMVVGPRTFPLMVGVAMLAVSAVLLWRRVRDKSVAAGGQEDDAAVVPLDDDEVTIGDWPAVWWVLGAILAMFVFLVPLGFIPTVTLFLAGLSTLFSPRHWLRNVIVAVVFSCFFFFIFAWVLGIPLPKGILAPFLTSMVG